MELRPKTFFSYHVFFPENTEVDLNEDFGDLSKTLEDLDINTELPSMDPESVGDGKNPVVDNFAQDPKGPPLPPFPELRYLNLSHNLVRLYCFTQRKVY